MCVHLVPKVRVPKPRSSTGTIGKYTLHSGVHILSIYAGDGPDNTAETLHDLVQGMKAIFTPQGCVRDKMNSTFTCQNPYRKYCHGKLWKIVVGRLLEFVKYTKFMVVCESFPKNTNIAGVYTRESEVVRCSEECTALRECQCSLCHCCSNCTASCLCPAAAQDPDENISRLLSLTSGSYRLDIDREVKFLTL